MFASCARLAAGGRGGGLERRGYNNRHCLSALKRGKQLANFWKIQNHLKDINESELGFSFSCRMKV